MVDLHVHTTFSEGQLIPMEITRRAKVIGIKYIGITDHADYSNMDIIVPAIKRFSEKINSMDLGIKVIPGVELTHIPPEDMKSAVDYVRELGAKLVVVHGETIVEPVDPGTNRAAIEAGADILAHPGLIEEDDVMLAARKGVFLEISGRKGHAYCNGHVVTLARRFGARLIFNTDSHGPSDLMDRDMALKVLLGAGLSMEEANNVLNFSEKFARSLLEEV